MTLSNPSETGTLEAGRWHQTACILCECNCGVEVRLGGDGRTFERVRGDKAHPVSKGYTCEKALRLDYYQNGRGERLTSPLRRGPDGTFEEIDWDTAIREVAERLAAVRDDHGGESIVYYGGGGQGNHLGGVYGSATLAALGVRYRSNAIAQRPRVDRRRPSCQVHLRYRPVQHPCRYGAQRCWRSGRSRHPARDAAPARPRQRRDR